MTSEQANDMLDTAREERMEAVVRWEDQRTRHGVSTLLGADSETAADDAARATAEVMPAGGS